MYVYICALTLPARGGTDTGARAHAAWVWGRPTCQERAPRSRARGGGRLNPFDPEGAQSRI